jgi:peptidyl-prolyl cis-trans isomerase D
MLRFFSRFKGLHQIIFGIFIVVLLIGLAFFGFQNTDLTRQRTGSGNDSRVIARVGSEEITLQEYRNQLDMLSMSITQGRGGQLPLATIKQFGLDKQALDRLIEEKLALAEARNLGLTGTDKEVGELVQMMPGFTEDDGKFVGREKYLTALRNRGQNVEEFENSIRKQLATSKLREYLGASAQVSDKQIEEEFRKDNTNVDLVYAVISNEDVKKKAAPTEEEIKSYYEAHKDEFKPTETLRKVEYLFIPTDAVAATMQVSDTDLKSEYESNKQYEPRVSIIKLNVLTPADDATRKAKADELAVKVRGSATTKAEDFAAVARGNSEDASARNGGDIGFIKKDANRPNDWKQRAFGVKVGDVDGPFRDGTAYYILKVTEQREIPFAEMRPTLLASYRNRTSYQKAAGIAEKGYEKFTEFRDISKAAAEIAQELNVKPETLIRTINFFKKGDVLPDGVGSNPAFETAVSDLKKGDIANKVNIPGGFGVIRLIDQRDAGQQLSYEDAKFQVTQKVRGDKEANVARQRAQEIVNQATTAAQFEALAKAEGLDIKKDTNFNSYSFGGLQAANQGRSLASGLKEGEVCKVPVKVGVSYLMFAATKRKDADMSKLAAERTSYQQRLIGDAQNLAYDSYIKASRKRYEAEKKITIDQPGIDAFLNSPPEVNQ